ncbi:MAG: ribonuclease III domain-containing protein, partial [Nodosilinea sp.]
HLQVAPIPDPMAIPIDRQRAIFALMAHPFWAIPSLGQEGLELINQALTHDSFAKEQGDRGHPCQSYERLEFLGDRILNHAVAEFLFRHYPEAEGALSNRIQFTKNSNLARVVKDQNLGIHPPLVRLGQGQGANLKEAEQAAARAALTRIESGESPFS